MSFTRVRIAKSQRSSRCRGSSLSVARAAASFGTSTYGSHFVLRPFCRCTWWPIRAPLPTLSSSLAIPLYPAETHRRCHHHYRCVHFFLLPFRSSLIFLRICRGWALPEGEQYLLIEITEKEIPVALNSVYRDGLTVGQLETFNRNFKGKKYGDFLVIRKELRMLVLCKSCNYPQNKCFWSIV